MKKYKLPLIAVLVGVLAFSGVQATKASKLFSIETSRTDAYTVEADTNTYAVETTAVELSSITEHIGMTVEVEGQTVKNSGTANQYIRVVVQKVFLGGDAILDNAEGTLGSLIEVGVDTSMWKKADSECTAGREVYYFTAGEETMSILAADAEVPFVTSVRLNPDILTYLRDNSEDDVMFDTEYGLEDAQVYVLVSAQGIQTRSAEAAALDAWGTVSLGFGTTVYGEQTSGSSEGGNP